MELSSQWNLSSIKNKKALIWTLGLFYLLVIIVYYHFHTFLTILNILKDWCISVLQSINDADIRKLSPLGYEHINIVGKYLFDLLEELANPTILSILGAVSEYLYFSLIIFKSPLATVNIF